ncbi:hypothetical protein F7725_019185 [Dissostichus mawsoni]|uniref:Uncharacterized protein n=1 Tax=Dissostichus mawsoni TaxID=36200 RepID=A0A7J5YIZ0_DISMA|nr:hypothetical protein F7725_019185 [Dissostichus mawsoni]
MNASSSHQSLLDGVRVLRLALLGVELQLQSVELQQLVVDLPLHHLPLRLRIRQLRAQLKHRLGFVTELSKAGAQAGHLLPTLVRNIDLIWVYFSEQQIHVHKGLVKLFLQHF